MNYRLRTTAAAEVDIEGAFDWYQSEHVGLGLEFLDEMRAAYSRIEDGPLKYQVLKWDMRRALMRRFPYAIYFIVENELVTIIAVMQAARDPASWQRRHGYSVSEK